MKRHETKRKKRNEAKRSEAKRNETKRAKRNETKRNDTTRHDTKQSETYHQKKKLSQIPQRLAVPRTPCKIPKPAEWSTKLLDEHVVVEVCANTVVSMGQK